MPDDFTLDNLAATLAAQSEPETDADEARDDENAQPEGEAQNDEQESDGQEQEADDDEGAESDEEEGEGEQTGEDSPQDRVVKWTTADGTAYEVPEKELQAGYMRQQDYTHKTQAIAREREQAESEIQNRAQQQIQAMNLYGEKLGELHVARLTANHLESALQQINREDDPANYALMQSDLANARQQAKELEARLGQANELMQAQRDTQIRQAQQEAVKVLSAEIPDLKDRLGVWNKHATDTYGFSPQELAQVTDVRVFRLLDDAVKYRDLQNRKPEAVKKAAAAPVKPAKQTRSVPPSSIVKAEKRHAEHRDVNSLAALLAAKRKD